MIDVRPIDELSVPLLAPLLRASEAEGFRFVGRLAREWASGAARFEAPGEVLLGAWDGDRLVAVGGITRDPYTGDVSIGRVRRLYVMPDARRQGIGRTLVHRLETHAASHFTQLVLRTDTDAAARFYESIGYTALSAGGTATHARTLP